MKYSDTGKFTPKQVELAKELAKLTSKARKLGLEIFANERELQVFKKKELEIAADLGVHTKYPIPYLHGGNIHDSGAPGAICFDRHEFEN